VGGVGECSQSAAPSSTSTLARAVVQAVVGERKLVHSRGTVHRWHQLSVVTDLSSSAAGDAPQDTACRGLRAAPPCVRPRVPSPDRLALWASDVHSRVGGPAVHTHAAPRSGHTRLRGVGLQAPGRRLGQGGSVESVRALELLAYGMAQRSLAHLAAAADVKLCRELSQRDSAHRRHGCHERFPLLAFGCCGRRQQGSPDRRRGRHRPLLAQPGERRSFAPADANREPSALAAGRAIEVRSRHRSLPVMR